MILPLRRWLHRLKYIMLFLVLTYAIYHVFDVVAAWIEPDKYREPGGRAVKVFRQDAPTEEAYDTVAERLRFFYWYGE
ncbi:YqzK family protein [Paenibacillus sp. TRM 82003]|nr:YqzK family protein [Paenibacillus sp. TRM 82003]